MTDYYRDRVRHGGILSNNFVNFWWNNQVGPMQYGNAEKKPRRFGPGVFGPPVGESPVIKGWRPLIHVQGPNASRGPWPRTN